MLIKRQRGDNYPIKATLSINNMPIDLTGSDVVFSFKLKDVEDATPTTIVGTLGTTKGEVSFYPTEEEMSVSGTYLYDIQRIYDNIVATHLSGIMVLSEDVSK